MKYHAQIIVESHKDARKQTFEIYDVHFADMQAWITRNAFSFPPDTYGVTIVFGPIPTN